MTTDSLPSLEAKEKKAVPITLIILAIRPAKHRYGKRNLAVSLQIWSPSLFVLFLVHTVHPTLCHLDVWKTTPSSL